MKKLTPLLIAFTLSVMGILTTQAQEPGTQKTFTLTGYYSPLPNQNFYVTGSYDAEIRLNGQGIAGADGTAVYPGMIAAPYTYPFGTVICIPSLGCGKVHDRGGAIVPQGGTDLARHDRLDIWMGYGDEGLMRALAFGVQHIESTVYPTGSGVEVFMNFEVPPRIEDIIDLPNRIVFDTNLTKGEFGEKVKELQKALKELGVYEGLVDGSFTTGVEESIFTFQKKYFIVASRNTLGAGRFGPQTRSQMTTILYKKQIEDKMKEAWNGFHFENKLSLGARNHEVSKLQQLLVESEFMTVHPTGYFGPVTQDALIRFQLAHGIITGKNDTEAGSVGGKTQAALNNLLENRKEALLYETDIQIAYKKEQSDFLRFAGKESTIMYDGLGLQ